MTIPNTEQRNDEVREALAKEDRHLGRMWTTRKVDIEAAHAITRIMHLAEFGVKALSQPPAPSPLEEVRDWTAELALLYNYADDDSRQFTRWQMLVAIQHGYRIHALSTEAGEPAPAELRENPIITPSDDESDLLTIAYLAGAHDARADNQKLRDFVAGVADYWNYPGGLDAIIKEAKALSETLPPPSQEKA